MVLYPKEYYENGVKPSSQEVDEIFIEEGIEKRGYPVDNKE